jgi:adenosylcobinamide-phosphate synthase
MLAGWVFLGAGALDEAVGDPEGWPHPVRVLGRIIAWADRVRMPIGSPWALRGLGLLLALGLPALSGGCAWGLLRLCGRWAWAVQLVLGAWMLAGRSLRDALRPVAAALEAGALAEARRRVALVVGRDTGHLDPGEVARAGLETLAESLCDGVMAPLFWFALAGLPGLWAFKAVSTLDSMVGHHEAPHTHFGWASARLDDLANWIPARLAALLIALSAWEPHSDTSDGQAALNPSAPTTTNQSGQTAANPSDQTAFHSTDQASSHSTDQASSHSTDQASSHSTDQASSHSTDQASSHSSDQTVMTFGCPPARAGGCRRALAMAWRDGGKTPSPNAGWPEAAFAGALGVQLGGLNHYDGVPHQGPRLGDPGRPLTAACLRRGLALALRANLLALALGAALLWSLAHG